jgi:hypothetical protein
LIIRDGKLRKVSDGVFQEADPPEDRSKPLEWRRSFNFISLPLRNITIVTSCSVHDVDFEWEEEKTTEPLKLVKADISEQLAITAIVDEEQMRDTLYFAVENKEEKGIFSVERASGNTNVSIKLGKPSEENERTAGGLYRGTTFRMNFDLGEDDLYFELTAPKEQLLSLISALRTDPDSTVEVGARLLSFTFEVDDALREHYHPREIILNESAPSFLSWAGVTSKIGKHYLGSEPEYDDEDEIEDSYGEELTSGQMAHQELLQVLLSYLKPLNGLVAAIWVLIVVIALSAIFS